MGEKVQVTSAELTSKAQQCQTARSSGPSTGSPPDGLEITTAAMKQLSSAVSRLTATLSAGDVEAQRLAGALNAAAGAYDKVDAANKAALNTQMNGSDTTPSTESVVPDMSGIPDAPSIPCFAFPESADWDFFTDWQSAARTIHSGDTQALSVKYMRDQWKAYKQALQEHAANFARPPADWEGDAASACEGSMQSLYGWWIDMGDECERLGQQAETLADAHDKLVGDHPTMEDVENFNSMNWAAFVPGAKATQYAWFQTRSELALREYANGTDLQEIRPGKPPSIGGLPAVNSGEVPTKKSDTDPQNTDTAGSPSSGGSDTGSPNGGSSTDSSPSTGKPSISPASAEPSSGEESSGSPSSGQSPSSGSGSGSGTPSTGSSSGLPSSEGMPEMPGLEDPSLKPASAGGGGMGGGAGGGMGAASLGPAVGADSVGASPGTARGGAVPGGASGGGGMGGMGGGMGGMGGGHGQNQGKEKRRNPNLTEDEDLYVEDRAHTEAVIGRRARKDVKP